MSAQSPTIHVVDDDASFRTATLRFLRAAGYQTRGYSSANEFLSEVTADAPGCVLLDVQMPGSSGLHLQQALAGMDQSLPIVFLTGHGDIPMSVQAIKAGAEDFLTKSASKEQLLAAIERALGRDARAREQRSRRQELRMRFQKLTAREREVLERVVQGKLNKQIASDFAIHERTVKLHRTSITTKLGVHSVAELTRLWLELGGNSERP